LNHNPASEFSLQDIELMVERHQTNVDRLNIGQRNAYDQIIAAILSGNQRTFFVDGPGGTGKTFLYSVLLDFCRSRHIPILPVASSGIAALLMAGGLTAHSVFQIPLSLTTTPTAA